MAFNWEEEINRLLPNTDVAELADIEIKYDYFQKLISEVAGAETLAREMAAARPQACADMLRMVKAVDGGAIQWQDGEEADLYAAMTFVTWYLHKSWKTLRDPLPVQYARVLGYVLLVGMQIGAYLHGENEHPDPEAS